MCQREVVLLVRIEQILKSLLWLLFRTVQDGQNQFVKIFGVQDGHALVYLTISCVAHRNESLEL